jgi:hypothetical protein
MCEWNIYVVRLIVLHCQNRTVVHLGNKGYPAEADFEKIVLQVLPISPSIHYSEVWRLANKSGIGSKGTLSKYLKRLENAGFIIRDESGYRKSSLYNYPRLRNFRRSFRQPRGSWQYSYFLNGKVARIAPGDFLEMVRQEFNMMLSIYAWMLTKLVETQEREAAQELVDLFLRCQINPVLVELARDIWISRTRMPIEVLKGKRLAFIDR